MPVTLRVGRFFLAIAMVGFGIEYFILGQFTSGLAPVPPWTPGGHLAAYMTGALLVVGGACLAAGWQVRQAAAALSFLFVLSALLLHTQRFSGIVHSGNIRTGAFEALALGAAALVLAGSEPANGTQGPAIWAVFLGRILFGFSAVIFGIQHFMYAAFIASLITPWIPAKLFLAYFTGCVFIATGLAMLTNVKGSLGALWLGIMFLLWVLVLHGPLVLKALHNQAQWASLFVALGMSGSGFIIAGSLRRLGRS
ncbi:MAG: hypothetical protein WA172_22005 [Terriglobales bacterium]